VIRKSVSEPDPKPSKKKVYDIEKRYLPPAGIVAAYGMPRYRVFEGIRLGLFRSVLLKRGNSPRNLRLIDVKSFEAYLAQHETMPRRKKGKRDCES
jgi:hypothetical protein